MKFKTSNLLLVGAGQLGSRHLQALATCDFPIAITVVDPLPESLRIAEQRFLEMPENTNVHAIKFIRGLGEAPNFVDLGIVATGAEVRLRVLTDLLDGRQVRNLILEKVLFQSVDELGTATRLLESSDSKVWVNCPRRVYPFYQELRSRLRPDSKILLEVSGGEWGLGCNSIHFVDLLAFLTGELLHTLDSSGLDSVLHPGKRPGYIELTGSLSGQFSGGSRIVLHSGRKSNAPLKISITTEDFCIEILEGEGRAQIVPRDKAQAVEDLTFRNPFQSELTQLMARDILLNGECGLTPYAESAALHKALLETLCQTIEEISGKTCLRCPIT